MFEVNDFDAIRISLASPEQIKSWSYGEVSKPETINYRTLKPERDGLFCERIFGPTKDYECFCGKYKRIRYKGVICDKCGVEVAQARVRRERMGHIELACPVAHMWFARGIPSRLGLLLDLSPRNLERVLYFSQHIITTINDEARQETIKQLQDKQSQEIDEREITLETKITEMGEASVEEVNQLRRNWEEEKATLNAQLATEVEQLNNLRVRQLLTESLYQELKDKYSLVFEAMIGAEAIYQLVKNIDLNKLRSELIEGSHSNSAQRRRKVAKQLQIVEAFRRSGSKPEWMILTELPVLPPDLRPMVQLDGVKFAISGINDLYRRVINRNNRLRHLINMGAPEIIIHNEKRMLQEAVDSLIDNGHRGQLPTADSKHKLKSLSDMLRGKQGRFRQNLLGKRVDYSGRSVIVVGPELKLHQCGLPKRMALELFKPFVMHRLMAQGLSHNIKSARRLVERAKPEVYDILEEVVKERPVLLNRAPTLHRLSIQAFEPVLINGSAIQLHPLVCTAFNADFDGDQMAVHVPLSKAAVKEAKEMMLSRHNILLPSSGEPVITPTLDIVLGCYYLTTIRPGAKGEGKIFGDSEKAEVAYALGAIDLRAEIEVREPGNEQRLKTSIGRIIFNRILPAEFGFYNKIVDKTSITRIVTDCSKLLNGEELAIVLDNLKQLGFRYATKSGTTIAMSDIQVPETKPALLAEAATKTSELENQFLNGLITEDERYAGVIWVWNETTEKIRDAISAGMHRYGGINMMANSGAKGNISQISQMAGMRGLMTNPSGKIIDFPIESSFREGLSVLEYFISTHGSRKGLADTALRTSESGYLTRRLVDASHDVIIREKDCHTIDGVWISEPQERGLLPSFTERIIGRLAATKIVNAQTGEIIVDRDEEINEEKAKEIIAAGITMVQLRSPLTCQSRQGICQRCYGRDLSSENIVNLYTAVGIIAAQSIGEPGTQLTLRTFHTGGVVGLDITSGLPRVEELFEARSPKSPAIIADINGTAEVIHGDDGEKIKITNSEIFHDEYPLPTGYKIKVKKGQWVDIGIVLATHPKTKRKAKTESAVLASETKPILAGVAGQVAIGDERLSLAYEEKEEREYLIPAATHIRIETGDTIKAGQQLTDGSINPQEILHILGREAVQQYLVDEVQRVYRSQGVNINDKHIEIIIHQMLSKVRIDASGDTELLPGELIDRFQYEDMNAEILAEGGEPATAHPVLLGVSRASLSTNSWLAKASFQETTKVLTEAAIKGSIDRLVGLKENVIIGQLIPARSPSSIEVPQLPPTYQDEQLEEPVPMEADKPEPEPDLAASQTKETEPTL
ncbi:MAG: DNA-directed RNA polymerase subunit beta' [Dehalococcoidales bacterium]|jgi:DNA-directed RNA polymerase subunit beta'|nr:DNA-directed RNA polymerase subunit beta' [Dehalococcoidales bacterium]MDP6737695.1 DNA-directed RNA polymerase subunit beta' [Dehalococcoidales bacterium]